MRARIDTDKTRHATEAIARVYDAAFFRALKSRFDFCGRIPDFDIRMTEIGGLYLTLRRLEGQDAFRKTQRREYLALKADTERFAKALANHDKNLRIAPDLRMAAIDLGEPPPKTDFPDLTDHQRRSGGETYLRELQRLLGISIAAAGVQAKFLDMSRGPKINFGLELMVRRVAEIFADDIGRPFTIDQHKPFKPTEAFLFIRSLVDPLDDVTDDNIASAIRAERNRLRALDKRASKVGKSIGRKRR